MPELPEVSSPNPQASIDVGRSLGRRIASLFGLCARPCTRFCGLAWPGAAVGLIVAALFFPAYGGLCLGTGLGAVVDIVGSLLLGAIILTLAALAVLLGLALSKRMPSRFKALVIVAIGSLFALAKPFGFSPDFALRLGGPLVVLPISHVRPLQPILKVTFTKWPYWERIHYKSSTEPVLQTYEIPLSGFVAANPNFDPGLLKQVRFRFDRTKAAVILLDDVGLTHKPDGTRRFHP